MTPPPVGQPVPAPRSKGIVAALPAVAVAAGGVAVLAIAGSWSTASVVAGQTRCPFRALTGLPCPGCGLTRSFVMLAHGDVGQAFSYNFFGPIFFAVIVVAVGFAIASLVSRRPAVLNKFRDWVASPVGMVILGVWMAYGVARIVDAATGSGIFPSVT